MAGADALARDLGDMADAIADTREPDAEAAQLLAREAKRRARRVTGYMGDHITTQGGTVEATAEYAPIVHEGWRGIDPNPFMTEAAEHTDVTEPYHDHIERAASRELRRRY